MEDIKGIMEDLDDKILEELKQKAIERVVDDTDVTNVMEVDSEAIQREPNKEIQEIQTKTKIKKPRSAKQIAAFEKAKASRAANLKIKKELELEKKELKKVEKESIKVEIKQRLDRPNKISVQEPPSIKSPDLEKQPRYREQVVNNYYYYGVEGDSPAKPKRKKKKIIVPETSSEESESESESDAEEPISYKELQNYKESNDSQSQQQAPPKYKFNFV